MRLITTATELLEHLEDSVNPSALVVAVDLTGIEEQVTTEDLTGICFLGCNSSASFPKRGAGLGALVLPSMSGPPVSVFPTTVYRVRDLYAGFVPEQHDSWRSTLDHRAFEWFVDPESRLPRRLDQSEMWAARTHDTFLEAALARFLAGRRQKAVGVMGGHDVDRSADVYRTVAVIARAISRQGRVIVTGGGPGLMEAANLGAFLAASPDLALEDALKVLVRAGDFKSHEWLSTAAEVRRVVVGSWDGLEPSGAYSLGIPTWLYGHEPPNMFASHSAKFFFNSLREDGLVTVADGGLLFARGNAGTVQEIFQDATQNYYRPRDTQPTPMVLLDRAYWDGGNPAGGDPAADPAAPAQRSKPLWPLLHKLGVEKVFDTALALTDDAEEIIELLTRTADSADGPPVAKRQLPSSGDL